MNKNVRPIIDECRIPLGSMLDRRLVDAAYFHDSYRTTLSHPSASVTDIFRGIFGHHPAFMKFALLARNRIVSWVGLDVPTASEVLHPNFKDSYAIGDKIGIWPILFLTEAELIVGHDDKHLDFRLSVLKGLDGGKASVTVSTVCVVHNILGKVYLFFVIPFHKWGVKRIIFNAVAEGRL